MVLKKESKRAELYDAYHAGFHGFEVLEREFRGDGWFYGRASDYVKCKKDIIKARAHACLTNITSDCFMAAPTRVFNLLKDSAIVLHGPDGCGNYLYVVLSLFKTKGLICTRLNTNDTIMGGERKLKEAIYEAIQRFNPGVIAVVETCTSSIIGEDIPGICETMEKETGIPLIPLPASGFRHRNWNPGLDEAFNRIIDRMEPASEKNPRSINYLNMSALSLHWKECLEVFPYLDKLGVRLNTHTPCFMTFQEMIREFPKAELNVVRCTACGFQTAEYAEKKLGIPYLRTAKAASIKYTEDFIRGIADFFALQKEAEALIKEEKEKIWARWERVRSKLKGLRCGIVAGPGKLMAFAQLAAELGMEVLYLGPVKQDSLLHDLLEVWLEDWGQDPEVLAEPPMYQWEAIISRCKPDIHYGFAIDRPFIHRVNGVTCVDMEAITIPSYGGFEGAVFFGEYTVDILENKLIKNWGNFIWNKARPYSSQQYLNSSMFAVRPCQKGSPIINPEDAL